MSGGNSGVRLGDSIYAALNAAHLPRIVAAFVGEVAVDLPDKLLTVIAALLIAQGLPQQRAERAPAALDLGEAFTFVFRSHRWVRKLAFSAVCLLFFWLIVPLFLLAGYIVEVARRVRSGAGELPPWDHPWKNIKDGFKIIAALLIWALPTVLLSIPAGIAAGINESGPALPAWITQLAGVSAAIGSVWSLVVLILEPAIIIQYIDRGFAGGLNVAAVIRRVRVNLGLSIVVGALVVVLTTIGLIGLAGVGVGVLLTLPYASFVGAYLVGRYAALTGPPALRAETVNRRSIR
jgi:uncharacterized protein DUF4013